MSPGVVIANARKDMTSQIVTTMMSRDGGHTWKEIRHTSCTTETCKNSFVFAKVGGVIAFTHTEGVATNDIIYTPDEGSTWLKSKLPYGVSVEYMTTKSDRYNNKILIIGKPYTSKPEHKNTHANAASLAEVILVDFSKLPQRKCFGDLNPGKAGSDYELWTPYPQTSKCFLGRRTAYVRRAMHKSCAITNTIQITRQKSCKCVNEDFACLPSPAGHTAICVSPLHLPERTSPTKELLCKLGHESELVDGYHLLDGDTCQGGVQLPSSATDCVDLLEKSEEKKRKAARVTAPAAGEVQSTDSDVGTSTTTSVTTVKRSKKSPIKSDDASAQPDEVHTSIVTPQSVQQRIIETRHTHKSNLMWRMGEGICIVLVFIAGVLFVWWSQTSLRHKYQKIATEDLTSNYSTDGQMTLNVPESLFDDEHDDAHGSGMAFSMDDVTHNNGVEEEVNNNAKAADMDMLKREQSGGHGESNIEADPFA